MKRAPPISAIDSGATKRPTATLVTEWQPSSPRRRTALRRKARRLAIVLERAYGTPDLGNLKDPLDEAVYILLTYQTDLQRARGVWVELKARFPSWDALMAAPTAVIEAVLAPSGLQRARTRLMRNLLQAVRQRWNRLSLRMLDLMPDDLVEKELRALPGFDIKGARCVMMYSLGREVFPVDSNVYRFMKRYGVIHQTARYRRKATHDKLQEIVEPRDRYRLHVNLVVHGQRTCLPRNPKCGECALKRTCPTGRLAATR